MKVHNYTVFPSIITQVDCDLFQQIRDPLIEWIYAYQASTETVNHSNRGGWQSPSYFYEEESFSEFKNYILMYALTSLTHYDYNFELGNMWININKKGDYNVQHVHANSLLSGVIWIKAPEKSGPLVFASPNVFIESALLEAAKQNVKDAKNYFEHFEFNPKEGRMILFPSHLYHSVEPNESDEDRISIAFNLK
jgi:hypothetical protein